MGMSEQDAVKQQQLFLTKLAGLVAQLGGIALIALTGTGTVTSRVSTAPWGVGVEIDIAKPDVNSRELRLILKEAFEIFSPTLYHIFRGAGSAVPIDTGFLRSQVIININQSMDGVEIKWPVEYARYLWDMDPAASGLPARTPGTLKNWSQWAEMVATDLIVNTIARVLRRHGVEAEVH